MDGIDEAELFRSMYKTCFESEEYLKPFVDEERHPRRHSEDFFRHLTWRAFQSAEGAKGSRCLDVGSGPTVHRLALASLYCDVLYSSDFSPSNCNYVNKFLKSSVIGPTELCMFRPIAALESFPDIETGANTIAERLKYKLKGSVLCDVLKEHPLGDIRRIGGPFDVAMCCGCLESASSNKTDFKRAIVNVSTLLKPGGRLILMNYIQSEFYAVKPLIFSSYPVEQSDIDEGLKEAGFEIVFQEITPTKPELTTVTEASALAFTLARKRT